MKQRSITRRLVVSVLLLECLFTLCIVALAALYERHTHFRAMDVMLQGRANTLLGAVQDAEDAADNVMLDRTGLSLPAQDVWEVREDNGRLLGRSGNWQGLDSLPRPPADTRHPGHGMRACIDRRDYRLTIVHGLRVVDPGDKDGGVTHRVTVAYGSPAAPVWRQVWNEVTFYALSSLVLLAVTGVMIVIVLQRSLLPLRQLAEEAEGISSQRWSFTPPPGARETRELALLSASLTAALQRLELSFVQQRRFVSDAAHELKTAVAVVKSSLQLLGLRPRSQAEFAAGLERSLADTERMEEIVARMLTLARLDGPAPAGQGSHHADISAILAATVRQFESMAELRRIAFDLSPASSLGVPLSAEECSLLCSNLVLNALQHSPADATVRIALRQEPDSVELRVEDRGEGIDAALLPHVFERFARGDPSRSRHTGGTGLGLSICKAIVDRIQGTIELESEVNQGTVAIVRLPLYRGPSIVAASH